MRLMLLDVRLAYAAGLWTARAGDRAGTGKKKFGVKLILTPDHPQIAEIMAAEEAVAREKWGPKGDAILKSLRATDKAALHNNATHPTQNGGGFEGMMYLSCRSDIKPSVRGPDPNQLVDEASGIVYSGCYGNAGIELWAQDSVDFGKRVNTQIRGFQFWRHGDSFAAGSSADADEFPSAGDTGQGSEPDPMS